MNVNINATNCNNIKSEFIGFITPTFPFDFTKSIDFLKCFLPMGKDQTADQNSIVKAFYVEGQTLIVKLSKAGTVENSEICYRLFSQKPILESTRLAVVDRIEFFLSLQDDLIPFYNIAKKDKAFASVARKFYGYHQVKFTTPFESACWAILSQRNPMKVAYKQKQMLVNWFKNYASLGPGKIFWAFPEPNQILKLSTNSLNDLICNKRKTQYMQEVAAAFNDIDEKFLRLGNYQDVESWLQSISGIGKWSSSLIMIRGLGRMEKISAEQKLIQSAAIVYGKQEIQNQEDVNRIAQSYGNWQGYWAHYLRLAT